MKNRYGIPRSNFTKTVFFDFICIYISNRTKKCSVFYAFAANIVALHLHKTDRPLQNFHAVIAIVKK